MAIIIFIFVAGSWLVRSTEGCFNEFVRKSGRFPTAGLLESSIVGVLGYMKGAKKKLWKTQVLKKSTFMA